jgi:hypothetical protein
LVVRQILQSVEPMDEVHETMMNQRLLDDIH